MGEIQTWQEIWSEPAPVASSTGVFHNPSDALPGLTWARVFQIDIASRGTSFWSYYAHLGAWTPCATFWHPAFLFYGGVSLAIWPSVPCGRWIWAVDYTNFWGHLEMSRCLVWECTDAMQNAFCAAIHPEIATHGAAITMTLQTLRIMGTQKQYNEHPWLCKITPKNLWLWGQSQQYIKSPV